jgi:exosortase
MQDALGPGEWREVTKVVYRTLLDCTPAAVRICSFHTPPELGLLNQAVQTAPLTVRSEPLPQSRTPLWQVLVLTTLLAWLYAPVLKHLVGQWAHDPNYSHGFFVPAFVLFVIWSERQRLRKLTIQPSSSGLLVLALGLIVLTAGILGAELFISRFSLLLVIAGLVVLTCGWNHMRAICFPWLFLLFMIPIPTIVFNQITFPLQLLASRAAAHTLPLLGVPVLREGNIIQLPAMALEVAEACSGIRSLMSLATLAIIYGYLMEPRTAIRVILALASIPIAVIANSLRIVGTGLLVQYWDPDKAQGFFHVFSGWLIFVVSLVLLFLSHRALQWMWPEGESQG